VHRRPRPLALPPRRPARGAERGDRRGAGEARPLQAPQGRRGEHPGERRGRRRRRRARRARLGDGVDPLRARQGPDRTSPVGDGQPARGLHRAPDRPQAEQARAGRRRSGARRGEGPRDGDVPRDQRAAGPARSPRCARKARRRGGRENRHLERLARDPGALEPRVRRRPGPPRLARAGSDPQHASLGRGQEAAQEVKYRAVIFDLWQTLVPWPADAAESYYRWMADAYGAPYERFVDERTSSFRQRNTGPIEDNLRSVATALAVEPDFDRVLAWRLD